MRPGKPLLFGRMGGMRVIGLPGNPVSSLVCAVIFLRSALAALLGTTAVTPIERAVLGQDLPANDRRQDYLRGALSTDAQGRVVATPFDRQDSSMLAALARASCLLLSFALAPAARAGDPVDVIDLSGSIVSL